MFLALATWRDWEIWQGDVETAFLGADMDIELYAKVPNWCSEKHVDELSAGAELASGFTFRLVKKAIPGCPQGPRLFRKKANLKMFLKQLALRLVS